MTDWKENAKETLKSYYLGFSGSQFDQFEHLKDKDLLLAKICYAYFGPPKIEGKELLDGYDKEQKNKATEIYNKLSEVWLAIPCARLLVGFIFVYCKSKDGEFLLPVFSIFEKGKPEDPSNSSRIYIDTQKRTYNSWQDWLDNNTLPELEYAYPKYGFFSCSEQCRYEFDPAKPPNIEFGESPHSSALSKVAQGADTVSAATLLVCGAVAVTSVFVPVAPVILGTCSIVGATFGTYGTARAVQRLWDKGTHGESLTDLESLTLFFSIVATPLHFGTAFVNGQLIRGATQQGRIFSNSMRMFATILNFSTVTIDGALLCIGLVNLIDKAMNKQLKPLDVLQFSMSVFFFTNTLMKPQTAQAIIEKAQNQRIQQFAETMTDETAQKVFDKFLQTNEGDGSIKTRSKIIRTINRIENADAVFGKFSESSEIKIGGRKGKTILVADQSGSQKRYTPSKMPIQSYAGQSPVRIVSPEEFRKSVKSRLDMEPEEVVVDGEKIFENLEDWQQNKVKQTFDQIGKSYSKDLIQIAIDIKENLDSTGSDQNTRLKEFLSVIEIVTAEMKNRKDGQSSKDVLNNIKNKMNDYTIQLKNDLAKIKNIPHKFADPYKALYHYRKHGKEFPQATWDPNRDPIEVYCDKIPKELQRNANLVEQIKLDDGGTKSIYCDSNDRYTTVFHRENSSTMATLFKKTGEFAKYMDLFKSSSKIKPSNYKFSMEWIDTLPQQISQHSGHVLNGAPYFANIFIVMDNGDKVSWKELREALKKRNKFED